MAAVMITTWTALVLAIVVLSGAELGPHFVHDLTISWAFWAFGLVAAYFVPIGSTAADPAARYTALRWLCSGLAILMTMVMLVCANAVAVRRATILAIVAATCVVVVEAGTRRRQQGVST